MTPAEALTYPVFLCSEMETVLVSQWFDLVSQIPNPVCVISTTGEKPRTCSGMPLSTRWALDRTRRPALIGPRGLTQVSVHTILHPRSLHTVVFLPCRTRRAHTAHCWTPWRSRAQGRPCRAAGTRRGPVPCTDWTPGTLQSGPGCRDHLQERDLHGESTRGDSNQVCMCYASIPTHRTNKPSRVCLG